jgi:uncharacterized repeat protein (TIGR01451 family)
MLIDDTMGDPVNAGDEINYTLTITNSDDRAINSFVYIAIPENVTYVDGSAYGGLTPVSMSQAAVEELVANGGLAALNQVAAADAVTALIAPVNIPANSSLADMGFAVTVNAGEIDGSVDIDVMVYESGYPEPLAVWSSSIVIEPVTTLFLPIIVKN